MAAPATTPISATVTRTTYEVDANGQTTVVSRQTGTFRRASNGSEVTIMLDPGTSRPTTEITTATGRSIVVRHLNQHYTVRPSGQFGPYAPPFVQDPAMESQTINGIYTVATLLFEGNIRQVTGRSWFSPEYGITIRRETERTSTITGKTIRTVEEMSNIQVGF